MALRLAYADPPYPGMAKLYVDHPDYAGEVDHAELVGRLEQYDGWALSTAASTLQEVLAVCPPDVRIGSWHVTNTKHPGNLGSWWWSWEAVIFKPARAPAVVTRDVLMSHTERGFIGDPKIKGQKPPVFSRWMFSLLGARPGDTLDDMFPGSGGVAIAWDSWTSQQILEEIA